MTKIASRGPALIKLTQGDKRWRKNENLFFYSITFEMWT